MKELDEEQRLLLEKRLSGMLPTIKIGEENYIIDWRYKEIRCESDVTRIIYLPGLDMNGDGTEYLALYDLKSKIILDHGQVITKPEENLAVVRIPYELKLDPVAVARQYGMEETSLVTSFPIQPNLEAKIEPLGDYRLSQGWSRTPPTPEEIAQEEQKSRGMRR